MKTALSLLFSLLFYVSSFAQCLTTGANTAGETSHNASVGMFSWSNIANAQTSDNNYATSGHLVGALSTINSNYLVASNLGFSIPPDAVICGIVVEVEASAAGLGVGASISDNSVKIVKGGVVTGTEHASAAGWPASDVNKSYGSNTDSWGSTWTAADINSSGFGMAISARLSAGVVGLFLTPRIDEIRITVYYNTPLPVKLKSFTAKETSNKIKLEWVTATETNNKVFVVEKSLNNSLWASIDSIAGTVDSYSDRYYHSFDNFPELVNYYRLKQVDFNGKATYSKIVVLKTSNDSLPVVRIAVNPPGVKLFINSYKNIKRVQLFNANSTEVFPYLHNGDGKSKTYNIAHLNAGIYFIRIYLDEQVVTKKILLSKK
ncbi:MAG TPA: T9SS type A sorting domain-containing protein [Chitinophagaceae bacterium]|nr:T9SS type A sorting domain-containing protein [Chitinophagaceae bacterium]